MNEYRRVKCCSNCERGIRISINNDVLCKINGVVTYDFICPKYRIITRFESATGQRYKCMDCEFFISHGKAMDFSDNDGMYFQYISNIPGISDIAACKDKNTSDTSVFKVNSISAACKDDGTSDNIGFCQLFTVRQYSGRQKNACSRFSKKMERIVP